MSYYSSNEEIEDIDRQSKCSANPSKKVSKLELRVVLGSFYHLIRLTGLKRPATFLV